MRRSDSDSEMPPGQPDLDDAIERALASVDRLKEISRYLDGVSALSLPRDEETQHVDDAVGGIDALYDEQGTLGESIAAATVALDADIARLRLVDPNGLLERRENQRANLFARISEWGESWQAIRDRRLVTKVIRGDVS